MSENIQTKHYVCVHGHFYQPPRENPWLEAIEVQNSAYPYHDWNARISAECYAPNAVSRILDEDGRIAHMINNYSRISFNFGPTLLRWMEVHSPIVYQRVIEADQESREYFSGHGSALAQAYHHAILPLSNKRDKYTEVLWGIRDFEHRFGRRPEGMWLPETAVDMETLDILAEAGIHFVILSPYQAKGIRKAGDRSWKDVTGGKVDPRRGYKVPLASRRHITVFFYEGAIARAVAFEGLLGNGEAFAKRLLSAFSQTPEDEAQLVHIATDGETYGHHHRYGEMALSFALHRIEEDRMAAITNYGQFLEKHPPTYLAQILENTSWSCVHGIERWRSDCGCHTGGELHWNQAWRAPLRDALDWLRDCLAPQFEREAGQLLKEPWAARNDYIEVILDRTSQTLDRFLARHGRKSPEEMSEAEKIRTLKLLELQRHTLMMYTSCGWFFTELSGIETVQVIQYAGRAVQLAEELFGDRVEPSFLEKVAQAQSNIPEHVNGERIYQKFVKPTRVELADVAAHFAISSLFEDYSPEDTIFSYNVRQEDYQVRSAGKAKLAIGRAKVISNVTFDSDLFSFAVLLFGDHNIQCGVSPWVGEESYSQLLKETTEVFSKADFTRTLRLIDRFYGERIYSLRSLFRDEQHKVLAWIMQSTIDELEMQYQYIYERQAAFIRFLVDLNIPVPRAFQSAAEVVINSNLKKLLSEKPPDSARVHELLKESRETRVTLETEKLGFVYTKALEEMMGQFEKNVPDLELLQDLVHATELCRSLPFEVNLWTIQNVYYGILEEEFPRVREKEDSESRQWVEAFIALGERVYVKVD